VKSGRIFYDVTGLITVKPIPPNSTWTIRALKEGLYDELSKYKLEEKRKQEVEEMLDPASDNEWQI
jgi:hypothetical protein